MRTRALFVSAPKINTVFPRPDAALRPCDPRQVMKHSKAQAGGSQEGEQLNELRILNTTEVTPVHSLTLIDLF